MKSLPESEQPVSLQGMHRAVRKWADIQREGQTYPTKGSWERLSEMSEQGTKKERKAKAKAEKAKRDEEAASDAAAASSAGKKPMSEHIAQIVAAQTAEFL